MDEEPRMSEERLVASLRALGRELAYPPTPATAPAVTARLNAPEARRPAAPPRPPAPGALGGPPRAAVAAAARPAIGAFEVRKQPGSAPSPSPPPVQPDLLGDPVPFDDAVAEVGFEPVLPPGPGPD